VQSFNKLISQDVGFKAAGVVRFDVALPRCGTTWAPDTTCAGVRDPRYTSRAQIQNFFNTLLVDLRAMPGAANAAVGFGVPFTAFAQNQSFAVIDGMPPAPQDRPNMVEMKYVSPGYFSTLGVRLMRGRDFNAADRLGGPPVAIVSEGAVKAYFGGSDPIGKVLKYQGTVIGVVADTKTQGLGVEPEPAVYQSSDQTPIEWMTVLVRASGDPAALMPAARARVAAIDRTLPVQHLSLLQDDVEASATNTRLATLVLSGFAAVALLLAVLGIYGLVAYTVRARQREVGIRVALGAPGGHIVALVVRTGIALVVTGVLAGVAISLVASRAIRGLVFGVAPTDPATYVVAVAVLLGVAGVASWLPARRAARIDPLIAMRPE
jgi:putative ABC transport system permease protein